MTQLKQHIKALALKHAVHVNYIPDCRPMAYPTLRLIHISPITDPRTYYTALHELGHVVLCHDPRQSRTWKELLAWEWARQNNLFSCFDLMLEDVRAHCLSCWGIPADEDPLKVLACVEDWN